MQEKKNNAVEKVENTAKKSGKNLESNKKTAKRKSKNSSSNREAKKSSRSRERAERKMELAKLKEHKKAEREKAKNALKREKNKRKAELKENKRRIKEERKARKEMLKHETRAEREKRLSIERREMAKQRAEEKKLKAQLKKQKEEQRKQLKQQKEENKRRTRSERRGLGGYLTAVISLGIACLVLASVLTGVLLMPSAENYALEATYQKSFYDTVEQIENIDLNLSKALASSDEGAIQKYLTNTAINAELAENDLQQLPIRDENKFYTTKVINQIGDYSKYLVNKLIDGDPLTESDIEGLRQLYNANLDIKNALRNAINEMGADYSFTSLDGAGSGNALLSRLGELQNLSTGYPELIYDGPFSDGQLNREIKGLTGEDIDQEQANEIFARIFGRFGLESIENVGMATGKIECYNLQTTVNGQTLYAQISKKGGQLIMFDVAGDCNSVLIESDKAIENAQNFLTALKIENVSPVWINLTGNVYTINFAVEIDSVIVYSDLIKIRVCAETGNVIGMEATGYYTNHVERTIEKAVLSEAQARAKVSESIQIDTARKVLCPVGTASEVLCYEFSGTLNEDIYYVYIDASNGRQVEMFKVIETGEGEMLM